MTSTMNVLPTPLIQQGSGKLLGTMTITLPDGRIVKSDGELLNAERVATMIQRMVTIGPLLSSHSETRNDHQKRQQQGQIVDISNENSSPSTAITTADELKQSPIQPFEQLSVIYPNHLYDIVIGTISNNGIAFSNIGPVSTSGNRQKQQMIHVVKRSR